MSAYEFPTRALLEPQTEWLVATDDRRLLANAAGWSSQERLEKGIVAAFNRLGWSVHRAHEFYPVEGHGFIDSQRAGLRVFEGLPPEAPLIVAEGVWQYSHHVLAGDHTGPMAPLALSPGHTVRRYRHHRRRAKLHAQQDGTAPGTMLLRAAATR